MRRECAGALLVGVASLFGGPADAADAGPDPRPGIVRLERAGSRLGFGMVLRSDGRILTSLSALGHGNYLRARFSDEHVLGVHVVATDRTWDLALLEPDGGHWASGLAASELDAVAQGVRLRRFSGRGRQLSAAEVLVRGQQTLLGRDGALLEDALLLGSRMDPDELGSPIFDERGEVIALVGQACDPAVRQDCRLTAIGVPVATLKEFVRGAPARSPLPAAWLGFRGVAGHSGSVGGVSVIAIEPGSPAEQAGLVSGELIVAVNDEPVTTPEELSDVVNRIALTAPGRASEAAGSEPPPERKVRLLVYGSRKFREASLPLRAPVQLPAPSRAGTPTSAPESSQKSPPE